MNIEEVKAVLEEVRPHLQQDGGDVEFVNVTGDTLLVRLTGACAGCPMSTMTLKNGIERYVREKIPEIKFVQAV